jgi:hypothetical protein
VIGIESKEQNYKGDGNKIIKVIGIKSKERNYKGNGNRE